MIDLVKFAETKNAALLTFCSVWIGSIITMLRGDGALPPGYGLALKVALPLLIVAALISVVSFLPKQLRHFVDAEDPDERNLLFFGDIAKLEMTTYAERLRERYHPADDCAYSQRYLADLVVQIAVHGRIANAKFKAFNTAATIVLAAFVVIAVPPSWWVMRWIAFHIETWRG